MYVGIDYNSLYIDQHGNFMFYAGIYKIIDSSFHSFRVIEYPYVKVDHYTVSMPFISNEVGFAKSQIMVINTKYEY